jgi:ribonuclease-3
MNALQQLMEDRSATLTALQNRLNYNFLDLSLLAKSLCHRSFTAESQGHDLQDNETLEFLGDAVLDLIVSSLLITTYPLMNEGELSKLRAALVNETHLAIMAKSLHLQECIFLGKGEVKNAGTQKSSILASTYEAVVGALFLDCGYDRVFSLIEQHFDKRIEPMRLLMRHADAKSLLQELTQQKHNETPTYTLEKTEGPDHDKTFTVSVSFLGTVLSTASAKSKKAAEQKAAEKAVAVFAA